jgi:uncharacterized membrane protein
MNWLGDHSSLVLFAIAPLYAAFRHPALLLVIQCLAVAMGALPLFQLARRELSHEPLAVAIAALYLINPAVGYVQLFEFHPEALATTPLLASFYFLRVGRHAPALAASCREDVALVLLAMAL